MFPETLTPTGQYYGSHGAELMVTDDGRKFLVKRQEEFRTHLDVAISQLQQALGFIAPVVTPGREHGRFIAVHQWLEGSDYHVQDKDAARLTVELAFDWLISNHDSHPGQFILTTGSEIVGLDKGQAFKHLGEDKLSPDYHPNRVYGEREPIYHDLKRRGLLTDSPDLQGFLAKVEAMDDLAYLKILGRYLMYVPLDNFAVDALADRMLARKHNLRRDVMAYIA